MRSNMAFTTSSRLIDGAGARWRRPLRLLFAVAVSILTAACIQQKVQRTWILSEQEFAKREWRGAPERAFLTAKGGHVLACGTGDGGACDLTGHRHAIVEGEARLAALLLGQLNATRLTKGRSLLSLQAYPPFWRNAEDIDLTTMSMKTPDWFPEEHIFNAPCEAAACIDLSQFLHSTSTIEGIAARSGASIDDVRTTLQALEGSLR
jgi:hypothetical protein